MKIILNTNQLRLLLETEGINDFMNTFINAFPNFDLIADDVKEFIINSKCPNIEISDIAFAGAQGFALFDRVVINKRLFNQENSVYNFNRTLYIIFHEISHSYQYKKYGTEKMVSFYNDEMPEIEAAKFMKYIENVADEFAIRKMRQLQIKYKNKLDIRSEMINKVYDKIPLEHYVSLIRTVKKMIKDSGLKDNNQISELMYNVFKYNNRNVNTKEKK